MAPHRLLAAALLPALLASPPPASAGELAHPAEEIGSIHVYLTPAEARARAFPQAAGFERELRLIPREARPALEARLGRPFAGDSLTVYIARDPVGALLGYAVIDEETGKFRPITFLVAVSPRFHVMDVAVLVYRESRGAEVRHPRFLSQYRGKTARDPIGLNRDIVNITGATLSARALNLGVRRVLLLVEFLYGPPG